MVCRKKLKLIFLGFILFGFFASSLVLAQGLELKYPDIPGTPPLSEKPLLPEYIKYLYNFSIIIAGLIAFFALIYGGFRYILSVGQPVAMADARDQISAGIVGLIILLGSYLFLVTINPQLTLLYLEKPPVPEAVKCDCSLAPGDLSKLCKDFCRGIVVPTNVYDLQEIPIGTLIEEYALNEDTFEKITIETATTKFLSSEVKRVAEELQDMLEDNCKCKYSDPVCAIGCADGVCVNDPCHNRDNINLKRLELHLVYEELEKQLITLYETTAEYKKDVLRFLVAKIILEEGLLPLNYDNYLELKQTIVEAGGETEVKHLTFLGETIIGKQDPADFYFDYAANEELIKELLLYLEGNAGLWGTIADLGWGPETSFPVAPGVEILSWPIQGTPGACLSGWYDTYNTTYYAGGCHRGIDISAPHNVPVYAARDGEVYKIEDRDGVSLGLFVVLKHQYASTTFYTVYAHLSSVAAGLNVGDTVSAGQVIGRVNSTGASTGDHLHFALQTGSTVPDGVPYDPLPHLPSPGSAGIADECTGMVLWPRDPETCAAPIPPFVPPIPEAGYCSVDFLEPVWGDYASEAACVCQAESGGNEWAINRGCLSHISCEWSVGLFQLNVIYECPGIIPSSPDQSECLANPGCAISNQATLDNCAKNWGWGNPSKNSQEAKIMFNARGWQPWSGARVCGLIP